MRSKITGHTDIQCPHCGSNRMVKNGHANGHQTWLCRQCHHRHSQGAKYNRPSQATKELGIAMYTHGMSQRGVAEVLHSTAKSVSRWIKKKVNL